MCVASARPRALIPLDAEHAQLSTHGRHSLHSLLSDANLVVWLIQWGLLMEVVLFGLLLSTLSDPTAHALCIFSVLIYAAFFLSFIGLHKMLHNPFLDRIIDVAHEPIVNEGLRKLAEGILGDTSFMPPGYPDFADEGSVAEPDSRASRRV